MIAIVGGENCFYCVGVAEVGKDAVSARGKEDERKDGAERFAA